MCRLESNFHLDSFKDRISLGEKKIDSEARDQRVLNNGWRVVEDEEEEQVYCVVQSDRLFHLAADSLSSHETTNNMVGGTIFFFFSISLLNHFPSFRGVAHVKVCHSICGDFCLEENHRFLVQFLVKLLGLFLFQFLVQFLVLFLVHLYWQCP